MRLPLVHHILIGVLVPENSTSYCGQIYYLCPGNIPAPNKNISHGYSHRIQKAQARAVDAILFMSLYDVSVFIIQVCSTPIFPKSALQMWSAQHLYHQEILWDHTLSSSKSNIPSSTMMSSINPTTCTSSSMVEYVVNILQQFVDDYNCLQCVLLALDLPQDLWRLQDWFLSSCNLWLLAALVSAFQQHYWIVFCRQQLYSQCSLWGFCLNRTKSHQPFPFLNPKPHSLTQQEFYWFWPAKCAPNSPNTSSTSCLPWIKMSTAF